MQAYWVFNDLNSEEHLLKIFSEILFYNGAQYERIILPIHLFMRIDSGCSFETTRTITSGSYLGYVHWPDDPEDCYAVHLEAKQTINIKMTPQPPYLDIDLYLYDVYGNLVSNSCSNGPVVEEMCVKAQFSGLWVIQLRYRLWGAASFGLYLIDVTVSQSENDG
jgi:hypothetical protein